MKKKITFGTRVAYGCGDTACNIVYGMISTLLTLFYTDYAGISPVTIGIVMLVRIILSDNPKYFPHIEQNRSHEFSHISHKTSRLAA